MWSYARNVFLGHVCLRKQANKHLLSWCWKGGNVVYWHILTTLDFCESVLQEGHDFVKCLGKILDSCIFLHLSCLQGRTSNDGKFSHTCTFMYNAHRHIPSRILETLNTGKNVKCLMALGRTRGKGLKGGCFSTNPCNSMRHWIPTE